MLLDNVLQYLRAISPEEDALINDPVGLNLGHVHSCEITSIGVCLDVTSRAVQMAIQHNVQLIVTHHPLIYNPLKSIVPTSEPIAKIVCSLISANIAVYSMHTNWDRARGGINDTLAKVLGLINIRSVGTSGEVLLPRMGQLDRAYTPNEFMKSVNENLACLGTSTLRFCLPANQTISETIAVCGGAGGSLAATLQLAGADTYVTSDVRHHEFIDAMERNLFLIDAGHEATETPGMIKLSEILRNHFSSLRVTWLGQPF